MRTTLASLAPSDLRAIAAAIRTGRLSSPFPAVAVRPFVNGSSPEAIASDLRQLADGGVPALALAQILELLAQAIAERPSLEDQLDLVTTGPECGGFASRDTAVVVADLFRSASKSVVIAGYAIHQGQRIFQVLAERMEQHPEMEVRFYLDIQRKVGDTSASDQIMRGFVDRFRSAQWPLEKPLPHVYYMPRSLALSSNGCSALHAKCVVVDCQDVFVSSANFTEAAQMRNIEVGLLLRSSGLAMRLVQFFESLAAAGHLERII